jgi:glycosyltransferase involved in cell wall biosynthesis
MRYRKAQELGYERLYPDGSPDLCHVHVLARSGFLALKLKRTQGIPFVITEHWSGYLPQSGALKASRKTPYYRRIANQAAAIHTVSQNLANAMKEHGILNKFSVIPNVVDTGIFCTQSVSEVDDSRTRTPNPGSYSKPEAGSRKLEAQRITDILFVGNLLQHPKRILDIIQVFARISKVRQDFKLHIYGEGRDEGRMLLMIRDLGMQEFLEFHGTTDRKGVAEAMRQADFLFLYSEFENQPCVINEALCCGCPVVVPDIEGIVEFMEADFGKIYPRLNAKEFEASVLKMMDDLQQYDAKQISQKAAKKFGESSIAEQFSVFYQNVLKNL